MLAADAEQSGPGRRLPPVIIGDGGALAIGTGVDDAALELADGTTLGVTIDADHAVVPEPLPVGCHTLALVGRGFDERTTVVVPPTSMPTSPELAGRTAVFAPAYALWEHDAPLPSFGHLIDLGRTLPALGVDALVTLPLYAAYLDDPFDPSPYAPISRLHWNEVYIDDSELPAAPLPDVEHLVDWPVLGRRRRAQLLEAATTLSVERLADVRRFVADTPDVADYASFRAKVAVETVDRAHPTDVVELSHQLAQLLAHEALLQLRGGDTAAFALDLPIGSHPLGFESWAHPDLFADEMSIGAPPDSMFVEGQNWGFAPQLPVTAERRGFDLWRRIVARCGRYASMLRIDHVLGVHRLWWIPQGMAPQDGVYVRYPRHKLLAVIAAEAAVAGTTVVGEDLGTVPTEITEAMHEWCMLGLWSEQLRLDESPLPPVPARTVAGLRTHDMEPFALLFQRGELARYPAALTAELGRPVGHTLTAVLEGALERLARSEAYLVAVDLDDLLGETTPHNIPGKVLPTIWRRRLRQPTSDTLADPSLLQSLARATDRGRR